MSLDGGRRWMRWTHGLPTASVMDLAIHPRDHDLVIATHGRGLYILDDLAPLRTLSADVLRKPVHLFPTPDAHQRRPLMRVSNRPHRRSLTGVHPDLPAARRRSPVAIQPVGPLSAELGLTQMGHTTKHGRNPPPRPAQGLLDAGEGARPAGSGGQLGEQGGHKRAAAVAEPRDVVGIGHSVVGGVLDEPE